MPFLLAGNGGGLRTGRWVKYNHLSHNNLLVSILNLFGDTRQTFGDPTYCTGPSRPYVRFGRIRNPRTSSRCLGASSPNDR